LINAAPAHPQTLGKLERFHRTLKEWLHEEGPPLDLEHLQLLLDRFRAHYNSERPHQGIGNQAPAERYLPGRSIEQPLGELTLAKADKAPNYPPHAQLRKVDARGIVGYDRLGIIIPRRYAGATVRILEVGELVHIYLGDQLIRTLGARPQQALPETRQPAKEARPGEDVSHISQAHGVSLDPRTNMLSLEPRVRFVSDHTHEH